MFKIYATKPPLILTNGEETPAVTASRWIAVPDGGGLGLAWKVAVDVVPVESGESKDPRDTMDPRGTMDTKAVAQRNTEILKSRGAQG